MRSEVIFGVLLSFLVVLPVSPTVPAGGSPIPFKEVKAGMAGTGYTVLNGTAVVSFRASVLGKVDRGPVSPRMIVCRIDGKLFSKTGLLHGMSGSPVYVNGRLLGAVSSGWAFSKEPVCGLTPAEDMLNLRKRASAEASSAFSGTAAETFQKRLARLSDFSGESFLPPRGSKIMSRLLADGFEWSGTGAGGGKGRPASPGPGGMIGVQLVSGDFSFTAFGTVSWRKGDEFVAFGHPFLGLGRIEAPVVTASVITPVPSLQSGFKLCKPGSPAGVVLRDGSTGVYGRFGLRADTLPVTLSFSGTGLSARDYHFEVVRHPVLSPLLVGGALQYIQQVLEGKLQNDTLILEAFVIKRCNGTPVEFKSQTFAGPSAAASLSYFVSNALDVVANNPYGKVNVDRVRLSVKAFSGNRTVKVVEAWLNRSVVTRGEPLVLNVKLRPFQGRERTIEIPLPTDSLGAGRVKLAVGDGSELQKEISAARSGKSRNVDEFLKRLASYPGKGSIVVAAFQGGSTLAVDEKRLDNLPPSVALLLGASPRSTPESNDAKRLVWLGSAPAGGMVRGTVKLSFNVKERKDGGS